MKNMNHNVRNQFFGHVRPAKIQISRRIRIQSSLGAFWIASDAKLLYADNRDSDQTAQADLSLGCALIKEGTFSSLWSIY